MELPCFLRFIFSERTRLGSHPRFPALLESPGESYGKLGEEGAAKVKEGTQVQPHVDVQVVTFQSEASDDDLQQETI